MSIYKAKTTEEAIEIGLAELSLTTDTAIIEIISQGGFLKKAEVNITEKCHDTACTCEVAVAIPDVSLQATASKTTPCDCINKSENTDTITENASRNAKTTKIDGKPRFALHENDMPVVNFLKKLFEEMEFNCTLDTRSTKDILAITIKGEDSSYIIGHRGEALDNLQYLCLLVANKKTRFKKKLIIDAEGYREIRSAALTSLALKLAQKCITTNRAVELEPMNPFERRIIHTALQENELIETTSAGTDPCRYVVINPVMSNIITPAPIADPIVSTTDKPVEKVEAAAEVKHQVCRTDVDIYDRSVSKAFTTSRGKTQSFGNKKR